MVINLNKSNYKISWLLLFLLITINNALGQLEKDEFRHQDLPKWCQMMYSDTISPQLVSQAFDRYYTQNVFQKNKHTQYFKRWMRGFARQPSWSAMSRTAKQKYINDQRQYAEKNKRLEQTRSPQSVWQGIGPYDFDKEAASTSYACGAAHVYTVEQSLANNQILYAGTATAGIWKSMDKGSNWDLTTADVSIKSVRALAIDPTTPQVVYAASDFDGKVYQTFDGGNFWSTIGGLIFNLQEHYIADIKIHPDSNHIVFLASDKGLYRSDDFGAGFNLIESNTFQEIEFHPTNPSIVYAVQQIGRQTIFFKSIDHGQTFTPKPNGWPVPPLSIDEQRRTEIAVSPADSNRVYALCTGSFGFASGLYGIYVSQDAGENWTSICCGASRGNFPSAANPNMMHWNANGVGNGGQYYYDLALEVSQTNADSLWVAGVNLWVSGDGGNSFVCPAQWDESFKTNYVHADIHDIQYTNRGELWVACDGGIFYSDNNGSTFQPRMVGIMGTDFWGFGAGHQDGEVMVGGTYHNGTLLKNNNIYLNDWLSTDGGDNNRGFVHPINTQTAYVDYGKKQLSNNRLVPNINTAFAHLPHASRTVGYSGNLAFHPQLYQTIFTTEFDQIWRTDDDGTNWQLVYDFGSGLLHSLQIAWENPNIMYVAWQANTPTADRKIYKTIDGGQSWTEITPSIAVIPNHREIAYDLALDAENPNILWAARISSRDGIPNLDGEQVFQSLDGGISWQNITTPDLNGEYLTNIEHQRGSNGGIYLGTRRGVYYRNSTMPNWALFNNGLPLWTQSVNLVPNYRKGRLINGTTRSVYEVDFYENTPPHAQIAIPQKEYNCTRDTVRFASYSANQANATYLWQFQGGQPSTSTLEQPHVVFAQAGTYSVTLTITDTFGSDTQVLNNFITITNDCAIDTVAGYALNCQTNNDFVQTKELGWNTNQATFSAWVKADTIQEPYTGIITHANDSLPGGILLGNNNELIFQWAGGDWNWNSGLYVPIGEWSHVALVITPDSARVYLNGVGSTYVNNLPPLNWKDGVSIGRYATTWNNRNFSGEIEEVCLWDTILTEQQIRATQHLTKYGNQEPHLRHYYQFNARTNQVQDRVGTLHATFMGGQSRLVSTAPIGGGWSEQLTLQSGGNSRSIRGHLSLGLPNIGISPNGTVVINRLNVSPDQTATTLASNGYWIINSYGTNLTFAGLDSIRFISPYGLASNIAEDYTLYQRTARGEGNSWGAVVDTCDQKEGNTLLFDKDLVINTFGQFMLGVDSSSLITNTSLLPQEWKQEAIRLYPNPISVGGQIWIHLPSKLKQVQLVLYNGLGEQVFYQKNIENESAIRLPSLAVGTYPYQIIGETQIQRGILIIKG